MGALAIQEAALPCKDKEVYIQSGLPWVHTLARKYSPNKDCLEDLISEGTIALLESYERYVPRQGVMISTFAYKAIRGECSIIFEINLATSVHPIRRFA